MGLDELLILTGVKKTKTLDKIMKEVMNSDKIKQSYRQLIMQKDKTEIFNINYQAINQNISIILDDCKLPTTGIMQFASGKKISEKYETIFLSTYENHLHLKLSNSVQEKKISFNANTSKNPDSFIMMAITDFNKYRRGQTINFRGIIMSPSKPMSKVELKITLQSGEDIFILKNSITDKFGVFSGSMETDRFMNPQKYQLVFSSKHLKISESKEIEISDYQKPSMKLDIDPIDSIMQGEPINVSATAMYFYGDPISNEVCELRVIDSDRDIAGTLELQTADDGTINQSISTEAISPGLCHVKVTVINSVGQVVEGTRSFRVFESKKNTQVSEEYQKFNTLSWSVSPTMEIITSQQSESTTPNQDNFLIKLKFDFESSLMVWTSRPIYYIWRDNDGCVIDYGYFYPKGIEDEELLLPIIAEKTYFLLDLIRIEYSGMYKLKTLKFLNDPSNIQIKLDGPDVLNPGESFDLQITTPNNSKSKSMLLAMLDSSSKEIAGSNIGDNFNTLFNEFHNNMEISNTFSEDIFELSRSLDEFFSYALEEWEEDTSLFPLSYLYALIISLYKSPIVDKKMFEYHQSNVLTLLSNNPESIIPFLYDLINLNLIDLIDFDEFDEELFKGNLLKLLQNIHSGLNNQENLQLLHLVRILLDKIHVEILSILKSIASIYPQFLSVIDVEKYTELNNLMKGKLLLNEKNFSDYLKVSKLISEQLSDLNLTKIMVKNIHLLWMDGEKLLFGNFFAADPYFSIPSFYGLPKYQSIMSDVDHYVGGGTLIPHALNLIPTVGKKTVRSYFPDVAYWIPDHIMEGNKETFQLKVPDSITEQEIIVLASTLSNDFGIARKKIHVQQEFFVQPQIPATIHYRDIFEIRAVVTNRTSQEQMVSVQLLLVNGGFQMYSKSEQKIKVAANSRKEVTWDVEAISVGTFPIEFTATTKDFQDIVKKSIRVDPKGLPEVRLFEGRLEKDEFDIVYSSEEVAHYLNVAFFPNKYSIALDGLEYLFRYPNGCVEQTISSTIPNISYHDYLKSHDLLTPNLTREIHNRVSNGYARLISLRNEEGAWGLWKKSVTSVYWTIFALNAIIKIKNFGIDIQQKNVDHVVSKLRYLQNDQGYWGNIGSDIHISSSKKQTSFLYLTCRVLETLLLVGESNSSLMITKGMKFIASQKEIEDTDDPLLLALYHSLLEKTGNQTDKILQRIIKMMKQLSKLSYWNTGERMDMQMETSCRILQILMKTGNKNHTNIIEGEIEWILSKKLPNSGWGSTYSTLFAIDTILQFTEMQKTFDSLVIKINDHEIEYKFEDAIPDHQLIELANLNFTDYLHYGVNKLQIQNQSQVVPTIVIKESIWYEESQINKAGLRIDRQYSTTEAIIGEEITVFIKVSNDEDQFEEIVVEENLPHGFQWDSELLIQQLDMNPTLQSYVLEGENLRLYPKNAELFEFTYKMRCLHSFSGIQSATHAYAMYEEEKTGDSEEVNLVVDYPGVLKTMKLFSSLNEIDDLSPNKDQKNISIAINSITDDTIKSIAMEVFSETTSLDSEVQRKILSIIRNKYREEDEIVILLEEKRG